jgi:hypothetical protein
MRTAGGVKRVIARFGRAVALSAALVVLFAPGTVNADCTTDQQAVENMADARGTTFLARVTGTDVTGDPRDASGVYTFRVERAYAGAVGEGTVTIATTDCHGVHSFPVGARVLFSTADWNTPRAANSLAWIIRDDGRADLIGFERDVSAYSDEIAALRTFGDALRAVAPGSSAHLPETSTQSPVSGAGTGPDLGPLGAAALAGLIVAYAFTRRRASTRRAA